MFVISDFNMVVDFSKFGVYMVILNVENVVGLKVMLI